MIPKNFDWAVFVCTILLCGFGLAIIGSVAPSLASSQLLFYLLGFGLLIIFANIDYRIYKSMWRQIYVVSIILLIITLFMGFESRGSTRWVSVFGFRLQFSEILKPFLFASLAVYLGSDQEKATSKKYVKALALAILPTLLIFKQPDLGSAIVYSVSILAMVFVSGINLGLVCLLSTGVAILIPLAWRFLAQYQKNRIFSFFNPNLDPLGTSYNAIQATIAVGSGMFFGLGLGRGTQSQLLFLPEHHTDFVFASLAEELGLFGAGGLILVYFVLIWRIFKVSSRSTDPVAKLLGVGIGMMILGQTFINIGMNLGIMPVTGITLPLVSYGGSSILATMIALGILENIASQQVF